MSCRLAVISSLQVQFTSPAYKWATFQRCAFIYQELYIFRFKITHSFYKNLLCLGDSGRNVIPEPLVFVTSCCQSWPHSSEDDKVLDHILFQGFVGYFIEYLSLNMFLVTRVRHRKQNYWIVVLFVDTGSNIWSCKLEP